MIPKYLFIFIIIFTIWSIGLYYTGYASGMTKAFRMILDNAGELLDIELTLKAKQILESKPDLLKQILTLESIEKMQLDLEKGAEIKGGIGAEAYGRKFNFTR